MGWTGYHATHYNKRGEIDRRAECDERMSGENEHGKWEILKSSMVGSTYYAAIRRTSYPDGESHVFGCVCLTSVDNSDWFNFSYKDMSEDMGPGESKCPVSILKLLDDTDNEYSLAWRKRCWDFAQNKNKLGDLPIGTTIEWENYKGETVQATKRSPAYQFKTPWWQAGPYYVKKNQIPTQFRIVGAA